MKYYVSLFMLFLLVACGTGNNEKHSGASNDDPSANYMVGFVEEIDENRVLITENRLKESFSDLEPEEMNQKAGNAVYFSLDEIDDNLRKSLTKKERISVKHGAVAESYPGQSSAQDISRKLDEDFDVIDEHGGIQNTIFFESFMQKVEKEEETQLRVVRYTTEGDPIFYNIQYNGEGAYQIYVDARQDNYGTAENVRQVSCDHMEYYLTEDQSLQFQWTECQNEGGSLPIFQASTPSDIFIPDQDYQGWKIVIDGEVLEESKDKETINDLITKIREANYQSVITMSLMAPDGQLILEGDKADIEFDYYQDGNLIRYNTYIDVSS
ncbi:DUF4362 domain-containing protein [Gracilibacillus sp. YIM 98692]|uniref:DUF4362 domain-containing protein n=1 Tax=Gracilibacillus sp. YIM 98692 TaxID=2663532 RepID=UPI0013D0A0E5|nr:DUF4362 domain-containing protein [Gracilibacillus sp. YIM 98692]